MLVNNEAEEASKDIEIVDTEKGWYPHEHIELSVEETELFDKFVKLINEVEDVQEFFHNVKQY